MKNADIYDQQALECSDRWRLGTFEKSLFKNG